MRTLRLIIAVVLTTLPVAAQREPWDVKGAHEITRPLQQMPLADRRGIASRVHMEELELRAERISTQPEDIFLVQSVANDSCGAVGNCRFWVLDSAYNIILKGRAQWASLLTTSHGGRRDIVTGLHDSAFESEETQWRFNGSRYQRFACADINYADPTGGPYKNPHITPLPCK
jgi:hypothetical protein